MGYVAQIVPVCVLFPCRVLDRIAIIRGALRCRAGYTSRYQHARLGIPARPPKTPT